MSSGNPSCHICSHGVVPLPFLLTVSTSRFRFFLEKLQIPPTTATKAVPISLSLSHRSCVKAFCSRSESPPLSADEDKLLTVSFLVECGLSPEAALRAASYAKNRKGGSKRIRALTVMELFRSYGFSDAQIDRIISKMPHVLLSDFENTIKPKLDFLLNEGFSMKEVADIFTANYCLLARSLETGIVATYQLLSANIHSRPALISTLKRSRQCVRVVDVEPKFKMLRDYGMPDQCILHLLRYFPQTLMRKLEYLEYGVKVLLEMGMDPTTITFGYGLRVISGLAKEDWHRKFKIFQEMGWSESEVIAIFKRSPMTFCLTEERLSYKLNFLKKNVEMDREFISKNPALLHYNIEGRIIPRVTILKVLMSKGLIENKWLTTQFLEKDDWFFKRYVQRFIADVPDIVKIYEDLHALQES